MSAIRVPFQDFRAAYRELKEGLDAAYFRFMESGWYVLGDSLSAFESSYADYCGARYAVGVANGLEALSLALRAAGIGPGDEVIVPSNTYIATWLAVTHIGAMPVAVEPDSATFNLDSMKVAAALSDRTRAILAVNLYGMACDYGAIKELAARHGLLFAVDNAQAQGARFNGQRVGGIADIECHSFYPSKNLGAFGEAGAITSNDEALAEKIRLLRNYGSRVRYQNEIIGYNSRLDELQAAFLSVKLACLDEWNARRARVASWYRATLAGLDGELVLPTTPPGYDHVWHLYVVRHPKRDLLKAHLDACGIQTIIHYPIPPHRSAAYSGEGKYRVGQDGPLVIAESLADSVLSLPMGPHMTEEQASMVAEAIATFRA